MQKAHANINWENYPSDKTPVNKQNLNKMDKSIDTIDDRVIHLDTSKFDKADAQGLIKGISFDRATGIFTITYFNNSTATIDTLLEKLAVNFDFDEENQQLIIVLDDGTEKRVDLSAFITPIEFIESGTIAWELLDDGKVKAVVKEGSIEEKHLRPDYLADIKVESAKAEQSATQSVISASESESSATLSKSWAVGDTGSREGEDTDNSKYYSEQSKNSSENAQQSVLEILQKGQEFVDEVNKKLISTEFDVDDDGNLIYNDDSPYNFFVEEDGDLYWEVA